MGLRVGLLVVLSWSVLVQDGLRYPRESGERSRSSVLLPQEQEIERLVQVRDVLVW